MEQGKVPTTPTTASVVAGIETQEAVKFLHGREILVGQGYVFDGSTHQSYVVKYKRKPDCDSHEAYAPLEVLEWGCDNTRIGDFLERVRKDLGPEAVIELNQDVLASLHCEKCGVDEPVWTSLGKVTEKQGKCPKCGEQRAPKTFHTIDEKSGVLDRTLASIGVPAWDILSGRAGLEQRFYEFAGDRGAVLGGLAAGETA
jgi:adenylyltransferase/sulfurtransferase